MRATEERGEPLSEEHEPGSHADAGVAERGDERQRETHRRGDRHDVTHVLHAQHALSIARVGERG
jgi:hypothetical protein